MDQEALLCGSTEYRGVISSTCNVRLSIILMPCQNRYLRSARLTWLRQGVTSGFVDVVRRWGAAAPVYTNIEDRDTHCSSPLHQPIDPLSITDHPPAYQPTCHHVYYTLPIIHRSLHPPQPHYHLQNSEASQHPFHPRQSHSPRPTM